MATLNKERAHTNNFCEKTNELIRRVFSFTAVLAGSLGGEFEELKDPYHLTELATGLHRKSIKKAVEGEVITSKTMKHKPLPKCSAKVALPQTPEEKGKRLLAKFQPEFIDCLRWTVHNHYFHEEKVVVAELKKKLVDKFPELEAEMSKTSLWRVLRASGFRFQRITDRMFVFESSYLTNLRHKYLAQVSQITKEEII